MSGIDGQKIAILGATGYIGRAILDALHHDGRVKVVGFSRDRAAACNVLAAYGVSFGDINEYRELGEQKFDVLINATGIGSPRKLNQDPTAVFSVTEDMDRLIFQYLDHYPATQVFNLSSGAVYGRSASSQVTPDTAAVFAVNALSARDSYALAKLQSEAKHRGRPTAAIVDLRVFAFVSQYLDPEDSFLVSDIAKCLQEKKTLTTKPDDMVRDFIAASDLVSAIEFLLDREPVNDVFDMKSRQSVAKFELLETLQKELGLSYEIEALPESSPTGAKYIYAPLESRLESLGYVPQQTSLENVVTELTKFLKR